MTSPDNTPREAGLWSLGVMLSALVVVFAMSHAFRTVAAIMADELTDGELALSKSALGLFAGSFHLAFAAMQPVVGVSLDRYGPKRTVLVAFAFACAGSVISAVAPNVAVLTFGQVLIGVGCAPALLAAMVFITRRYPLEDFARVSGLVLGLGGLGTLITATPLAWVISSASWRTAFVVLAVAAAVSWLAVLVVVDDADQLDPDEIGTLGDTVRGLGAILRYRYTWGILCLAGTTYAAFLALRGLWLGPLLTDRHDFSTVAVGNVALVVSLVSVAGPIVFGYLDPGGRRRRGLIIGFTLAMASMFAALSTFDPAALDVALMVAIGLISGYIMLQYADLRSAYPPEQVGRALSLFTMAMFTGVAAMQWFTGVVASGRDDPGGIAMLVVTLILVAAVVAYWSLPWPPALRNDGDDSDAVSVGVDDTLSR